MAMRAHDDADDLLTAEGLLLVDVPGKWTELIAGRLVVRETRVASAAWPAGRAPLRIAVLTDLHVGSFRNGLDRLEERLSGLMRLLGAATRA